MRFTLGDIGQPTAKGFLSLPDQSQNSKAHFSDTSLPEHTILMWRTYEFSQFSSVCQHRRQVLRAFGYFAYVTEGRYRPTSRYPAAHGRLQR
jgi:hypothetical protein